ncbi:MAG: phage tail protein [Candidatus Dormiibacterota bacterium]
MPPGGPSPRGHAARFQVIIDGQDLGAWSKVSGLEVDFQHETYEELGNNMFVHALPKAAKYSKITLQRACTAEESTALQAWLGSIVMQPTKGTACITLHDAAQGEVISWTLTGVFPSSWKGPELEGKSSDVAIETLVLSHEGFLN